jgi:hypothetical protein
MDRSKVMPYVSQFDGQQCHFVAIAQNNGQSGRDCVRADQIRLGWIGKQRLLL